MKNKYFSTTFKRDCQTGSIIRVKSNWLAMSASTAGWVITGILGFFVVLGVRGANFKSAFSGDIDSIGYIIFYVVLAVFGFIQFYQRYFPRQWKTSLTVNLEEKTFTIVTQTGTEVLPFAKVSRVIHQGVATIFATNYLFWAEVEGQLVPLVAFSNQPASTDFFLMLSRRTNLALRREEGN